ncbi:hypothetical protein HYV64_01340 [Candidatus Shapirobacteria bacterium]|nr:hypothetical protein [Candidatus Shapirobacteria bacterium]
MKKMLILTFVLIVGMGVLVWKSVETEAENNYASLTTEDSIGKCGEDASRNYLFLESEKESVRKLGELEGMCGSSISNKVIIRVNIPTTKELAMIQASTVSKSILEIRDKGLIPLIYLEASSTWDDSFFTNLAKGGYNTYILDFLTTLNQSGVKSDDVYGWVVIPQANLPNWTRKYIAPTDFTKYYLVIHENIVKIFPESDVGVLFNSSSYQEHPVDWSNRDYRTLTPYVVDVPKGKINIVGIEGYPSIPSVGTTGAMVISPAEYLPKFLIEELIVLAEPKKVIVSTNTFSALNADDKEKVVLMPADTRATILDETLDIIKTYKVGEAKLSIVLGSPTLVEYKGADWDYFGTVNNQNSKNKSVLLGFLQDLYKNKIDLIYGY